MTKNHESGQPMPANTAQLLLQIINENYRLAQQLAIHLEGERACIVSRDFIGHKKILDEKAESVKNLEQSENHLMLIFKKLGIKESGPAKIDALIMNSPASHKSLIRNSWNALKAELRTCKHLNAINGRIVQHSQGHVGRLLSIIKGQDQQTNLYRADGQTRQNAGTRSLARA